MTWLNGKGRGADALTSPPVPTAIVEENRPAEFASSTGQSNAITPAKPEMRAELARFMPVMDIEQAVQRRQVIVEAMKRLMQDGVDYGKVAGGEKPALFQPGADKLGNLFGLVLQYEEEIREEDWTGATHNGEPFFYYKVKARAFRDSVLIGEGVGSCSSFESKYRWRKADRRCPDCGAAAILKSKHEPGWFCWKQRSGCGANFKLDDPAIVNQTVGRIPNPDIGDQVNTILKMAHKRAKIAATVNATSAAEFFTQDVEDFTPPMDDIDTGGHPAGTRAAAQHVATEKVRTGDPSSKNVPWKTMRDLAEAFRNIREAVGETAWLGELERWGWKSFQDLRNAIDRREPRAIEKATQCYWALDAIARKEVA